MDNVNNILRFTYSSIWNAQSILTLRFCHNLALYEKHLYTFVAHRRRRLIIAIRAIWLRLMYWLYIPPRVSEFFVDVWCILIGRELIILCWVLTYRKARLYCSHLIRNNTVELFTALALGYYQITSSGERNLWFAKQCLFKEICFPARIW